MRKKITSVALAVIFSLSMAGVSLAAKCKGKVDSVDKDKGQVTITVDDKCDLKCGQDVEIKTKRRMIEGC